MLVPVEFLRGLIGFIGIGCAYLAGRSTVAVRKGWQKPSRLTGWILRMALCLAAVAFRHALDFADVAVVALAAGAAVAVFLLRRRRTPVRRMPPLALFGLEGDSLGGRVTGLPQPQANPTGSRRAA